MRQKGFALLPALIIVATLMVLVVTVPSLLNNSQTDINTSSVKGKNVQVNEGDNNSKTPKPEANNKYLENSIKKLEKIESRIQNKEIKTQITQVIEEEEQADENIDTSIASMEARPGYLKVIMGGDYKNAGQVRSEIVHLRNQISKLNRIQDKVSPQEDTSIGETIKILQDELLVIDTKLMENLEGFSLFGWLNKLLAGFTLPVASPSPSGTPTITPIASPTPTTEPTTTPTESSSPTPEPSATP